MPLLKWSVYRILETINAEKLLRFLCFRLLKQESPTNVIFNFIAIRTPIFKTDGIFFSFKIFARWVYDMYICMSVVAPFKGSSKKVWLRSYDHIDLRPRILHI